jgi:DNA-binding beta-propeller fold protein YncE
VTSPRTGLVQRRTVPRLAGAASLLALSLTLLVAGCSRDASGGGADHQPAEPARAPQPTVAPAGTARTVAPAPQGIAYDARTDSLAVAVHDPYRLLVLDPTTMRTRFSVQLPGKVRHLQVTPQGGTALVPSETADSLFEVDLRTGRTRRTEVQRHPHDAVGAADGDVLVANEFSGSVSVVHDGTVVHTFDDLRQPGGVAVVGGTLAVVDVRAYTVSTYGLRARRRLARVPGGSGPSHVVLTGDGRLAVADTRGNALLLYALHPLRRVGRISLPGSPYGLAADPRQALVWVTLTGRNQLVGVDVSSPTARVVARYATVRQPDTVAVAPGSRTLWVTGTAHGEVQRIRR